MHVYTCPTDHSPRSAASRSRSGRQIYPPCTAQQQPTLIARIWVFNSLASLVVTLAAMTARLTPQARPIAVLLGKNTYGTFLSSQSRGRWRTISIGSTSAAMTMNSQIPRLSVLVASLALSISVYACKMDPPSHSPLLQLLVMRSLLDKVEDLRVSSKLDQWRWGSLGWSTARWQAGRPWGSAPTCLFSTLTFPVSSKMNKGWSMASQMIPGRKS